MLEKLDSVEENINSITAFGLYNSLADVCNRLEDISSSMSCLE